MKNPSLLVFVRHAESVGNTMTEDERASYYIPNHQYGLTQNGLHQAKKVGIYLEETFGKFDAYFSSPYKRAIKTAQIACPSAAIKIDPDLIELQKGIWHTMTRADIQKAYPDEIERFEKLGYYYNWPKNGENCVGCEGRIKRFLAYLREFHSGERVLVFGHGHWSVLLDRILNDGSVEEVLQRFKDGWLNNASVTQYEDHISGIGERFVRTHTNIICWNDLCDTIPESVRGSFDS